jgi:hypothetical protein
MSRWGIQPAHRAVDLLFSLIPDAAGVDYYQVRAFRFVGPFKVYIPKEGEEPVGVVLVHLTAEGVDKHAFFLLETPCHT